MMYLKRASATALAAVAFAFLFVSTQAQASLIIGTATVGVGDNGAFWDSTARELTINGTISVGPGSLQTATFEIVLGMDSEDISSALFSGTLVIETGLLSVDVNSIGVTFPPFDGDTFAFTSYNFSADPSISITGGTEASLVSAAGAFSIFLDDIVYPGAPNWVGDPGWFENDFTAHANLTMETAPEPGTFLLLAGGLGAMAGMRRRQR